jgi:actin-like ATPase involved in cell morphogenesis
MTDGMLQGFVRKINFNRIARPRMVICVPSGVTEVERRAVKDSGERANAREIFWWKNRCSCNRDWIGYQQTSRKYDC